MSIIHRKSLHFYFSLIIGSLNRQVRLLKYIPKNQTEHILYFFLFILAVLKNAIDQVYGTFLPKGNHPFVYMNLLIESNNVDVNVHPTKHEVHFLYENEIIEQIRQAFETQLVGSNETRDLYTQSLLPGASNPTQNDDNKNDKSKEAKVYAKDMVRSDSKEQKLEKFFGQCVIKSASSPSQVTSSQSMDRIEIEQDNDDIISASQSSTMMSMSQTSILVTSQRTTDNNKQKYGHF